MKRGKVMLGIAGILISCMLLDSCGLYRDEAEELAQSQLAQKYHESFQVISDHPDTCIGTFPYNIYNLRMKSDTTHRMFDATVNGISDEVSDNYEQYQFDDEVQQQVFELLQSEELKGLAIQISVAYPPSPNPDRSRSFSEYVRGNNVEAVVTIQEPYRTSMDMKETILFLARALWKRHMQMDLTAVLMDQTLSHTCETVTELNSLEENYDTICRVGREEYEKPDELRDAESDADD